MITTRDETNDLMKTLFTLGVITESTPEARQQIADAYSEARVLAATIPWERAQLCRASSRVLSASSATRKPGKLMPQVGC